jgi:hypothetical protein
MQRSKPKGLGPKTNGKKTRTKGARVVPKKEG